jgi:hypothetical protein
VSLADPKGYHQRTPIGSPADPHITMNLIKERTFPSLTARQNRVWERKRNPRAYAAACSKEHPRNLNEEAARDELYWRTLSQPA